VALPHWQEFEHRLHVLLRGCLTFLRHFGHRFIASLPSGWSLAGPTPSDAPGLPLLRYPAPCPPRPASVVGSSGSSPGCCSSSVTCGTSWRRRRLDCSGLSAPTARSAARRTRGPYERATNALGSSSGWGLVSRCRPAPSRPVCVWRTCRAHRSGRSAVGIGSTPRSDGHSGGSSDGAGRRTRGYGAVRAGAGGGVVAGCAIRAPQEQASHIPAVPPAVQVSAPLMLSDKGH
jgi:hypothetical protein